MLPRRPTTPTTLAALAALPALVALAAGAALASAPTAAHAETWSHRDATGDVVATGGESAPTAAPTNRTADLHRVTITHTRGAVRVVARVHELRRTDQLATVQLRAPGLHLVTADLVRIDGGTAVHTHVETQDEVRECPSATGRFRLRTDTFVVTVPRACLGRPDWVRAAVGYVTIGGSDVGDEQVALDDGLRDGFRLAPRWSPRIHAG
ncbi:hypothetical protein FE634_19705 [Nocardioides dongxiaopingii]|uniref:hypothetical protein n=1 Tax=Nocardioides TaxID=1839 RepID=UPI0010C770AC|nr:MULTISPECIES: hypothetical protein [Nocardioides]QCW52082.1 hypothetical protein FE634_19705 [Nocardioides sp. S-1144]